MGRIHVVGAGLAGLVAALTLADAGREVSVHEAGPAAGGRCRSYFDRALGCRIDNGNHLLLSGNRAAFAWLDRLGTTDTLAGPAAPCFPFIDLASGARWTVRPNAGRIPWWILVPSRRVPGAGLAEHAALLRLLRAGPAQTVAAVMPGGKLGTRLIAPLAIAALNTPVEVGSARLLGAVMRETLARGGAACLPRFPREGLSESLIEPAVLALREAGAEVAFGRRVAGLEFAGDGADGHIVALTLADGRIPLGAADAVVLAVPAPVAASLVPELTVPQEYESILNLHYRTDAAPAPELAEAGFVGVIGGLAEWVFAKPGVISVTVSAANHLSERASDELAATVWPEAARALGLADRPEPGQAPPPWRVLRERRATFAATPAQDALRPGGHTRWTNLVLAGDWTATRLPATIEGAIRSGRDAATLLQHSSRWQHQ